MTKDANGLSRLFSNEKPTLLDTQEEVLMELGAQWQPPELRYCFSLRRTEGLDLEELVPGLKILVEEGENVLAELPYQSKDCLFKLNREGLLPAPEESVTTRLKEQARLKGISVDFMPDLRRLFN